MNVKARAEAVGTYRHVNVFVMETLASWVPTTPEMEVKTLCGRHLWLVAQTADRFGSQFLSQGDGRQFGRVQNLIRISVADAAE